jgi:hypothetical protein
MMPINMNGCRRAFQSPLAAHGLRSALAICLLALLLGACAQTAPRPDAAPAVSVMVVPSSSDGHVGAVTVRPLKGGKKVLLDQPFVSATVAGDGSVQTAKVDPKQAKEDFAAARAALPKAPTTLLVFFVEGTDTLQPEARQARADGRHHRRRAQEPARRDHHSLTGRRRSARSADLPFGADGLNPNRAAQLHDECETLETVLTACSRPGSIC